MPFNVIKRAVNPMNYHIFQGGDRRADRPRRIAGPARSAAVLFTFRHKKEPLPSNGSGLNLKGTWLRRPIE